MTESSEGGSRSNRDCLIVFSGPSASGLDDPRIIRHSPASAGDLATAFRRGFTRIVYADSLFFDASPTHREIIELLELGVDVIGCSSAGALRAAELRSFGMRGIGIVHVLARMGVIADDGELGVLLNDDYSAAAYSLLQVRYYLGYLLHMGVARTDVSAAFEKIAAAYFMLRSAAFIEDTIRSLLESQHARSNWWQIGSPVFDLKGMDLERALRQELRLGPPMPRVNMQWMRLGLSLGLPDRAPRWC